MNIESVVAIASLCITILGCSWHLSSKIGGMDSSIAALRDKVKDHCEADEKEFEKVDRRIGELFNQIRNMMTLKIDRS